MNNILGKALKFDLRQFFCPYILLGYRTKLRDEFWMYPYLSWGDTLLIQKEIIKKLEDKFSVFEVKEI